MHKALDQMNIQLHHVISDLTGSTGMAIVQAIVAGERNAKVLAQHRDHRIKASEQIIEKSLLGDWREEHLLVLRLALRSWEHLRAQINELDLEIARRIMKLEGHLNDTHPPLVPDNGKHKRRRGNPFYALGTGDGVKLRQEYYRALGTDLTAVPAICLRTVQGFLAEVGTDLGRFKSSGHFVSWLGLCPGTKISGGKVLDARIRKGKPRFALLLRQACQSLHSELGPMGMRYRRLRSRLGAPKALTAMAHTLARIIYALVSQRQAYNESIFAQMEAEHVLRQQARFKRQAQSLGYQLVPIVA
jgi:hypothetical protein